MKLILAFLFNKRNLIFFLFLIETLSGIGQECNLIIKGSVFDESNALPFATIYIKELNKGDATDENGNFFIKNICSGEYHIQVSHIGCESKEYFINLKTDTLLKFSLNHHHQLLDEVSVEGIREYSETQAVKQIGQKKIAESANKNLGAMLNQISGVSSINSGNRVAKPVVQGLYGNRLLILNNGIPQSGQQWGVDHAPEIDPLNAQSISVIKGSSALEYQGSNLGSVVLVESNSIRNDPHLHGHMRYFFESNGLSNGVNVQLEQGRDKLSWKVNGTFKKSGDQNTPDYFLSNSAYEEANGSAMLKYKFNSRFNLEAYASTYNAEIGILRGSQVGNITDLELALEREQPYFTEEEIGFDIEPPKQQVNHHLAKIKGQWFFNENQFIDIIYSQQWNFRKEFDIRRGGRSEKPSLSLDQETQYIEAKYNHFTKKGAKWKVGTQYRDVTNINVPGTGIRPLIPNYLSNQTGFFAIWSRKFNLLSLEGGLRYDIEDRRVAAFNANRELENFENTYHNYSGMLGLKYRINEDLSFTYNIGLASRNPEVNELYSFGLHQGVGGIEEGNKDLDEEQSLKQTVGIQKHIKEKYHFEILGYYQYFQNYIFLNPQDIFRVTIRGAFPLFAYEQTKAELFGFDAVASAEFNKKWSSVVKYSFLRGNDLDNNEPIVFLPSNNFRFELNYQIPLRGNWENLELQLNQLSVFEQRHLNEDQDFTPPPESYYLFGFRAGVGNKFGKTKLNTSIQIDNIFNVAYRDYLNRQRYFADDIGRNISVILNYTF